MIAGELWNVDLWFFDKDTIRDAESYCDNVAHNTSRIQKDAVIQIKNDLISMGLYSDIKYRSIDVYKAVMEKNVKSTWEFLALYN